MEKSEFDKLSKQLDEKERQELLSKISEKSGKKKVEENPAFKKVNANLNKTQQLSIARKEFDNKSFIDKLMIMLRAVFSGRKKEDVIINEKLSKIKREIQNKYYHLINLETNVLSYRFLNLILELVDATQKVIPIVKLYFEDEKYYNSFLAYVLESQFNAATNSSYEEAKPQSLKIDANSIFDCNIYLKEKERRIKNFFSNIEKSVFENFINGVYSFDKLIRLINYNYLDLIRDFSMTNPKDKVTPNNTALFKSVDFKLEQLYILVNDINFTEDSVIFLNDFIEYSKKNPISESIAILKQNFVADDVDKFYNVIDAANDFLKKVPLQKIFQYYRKDILYQPRSFIYTKNFLEIYKGIKKAEFDELWETYYMELRKQNLAKLVSEAYPDFNFDSLENFSVKLYNQFEKFFNKKAPSIYYLNLFNYFLTNLYKNGLESALNKIIIEGNFIEEQVKFHLSGAYHSFNNNYQKINEFDTKLSYENEYGKKIMYYIAKLSRDEDADMRKQASILIDDIINQSNNIVKDMNNSLNHIKNFFYSITDPKGGKQITNIDSIKLGVPNVIQYVEKINDYMNKFYKIYRRIESVY
jgi:hypothetical protein